MVNNMALKILFLLAMIFFHVLDDYGLQGILASMKQKSWWEAQYKTEWDQNLYKHDYIVALLMHGFSWAFMIFIPVLVWMYINSIPVTVFLPICIIGTGLIHSWIDNEKANKKSISLVEDQVLHIFQILYAWFEFFTIV